MFMRKQAPGKEEQAFIIDNSQEEAKALNHLRAWLQNAQYLDIATGYFEIGALLALDGYWQKLKKIRILMGDETSHRTKQAISEALQERSRRLDKSIDRNKESNPFLKGVDAVAQGISKGQVECRIYNKLKFHAKGYIVYTKKNAPPAHALVGSSNFTRPGLERNLELNVKLWRETEVNELEKWYERYWNEAENVNAALLKVIERHTHPYTPFEVYAKALHELFHTEALSAEEWDEKRSKIYPKLDRYQKEGYRSLLRISKQHGGALLCDGVGLGKTFVGLMLIERLVYHEGQNVLLLAPKAAKEAVWQPHLESHLPEIIAGQDFNSFAVYSHTDLIRKGEYARKFQHYAQSLDAVIIDEAHHFRNRGSRGETWKDISRYWRLYEMLENSARPKKIYMLTATPVNNRLSDFRHMLELFTRQEENYFGESFGVHNLTSHFNIIEKELSKYSNKVALDMADKGSDLQAALSKDKLFQNLVVQRSRAYVIDSQKKERGNLVLFPKRSPPQVAPYSLSKSYGPLLAKVEKAFLDKRQMFSLAIYYPLAYYIGKDKSIDPLEEGRQKQVVSLIRTMFLKRFESSVHAFELSCLRLLKKLFDFVKANQAAESDKKRLERWLGQNQAVIKAVTERHKNYYLDGDMTEEQIEREQEEQEESSEDIMPEEFQETELELSRKKYKVDEIVNESCLDMDQLIKFLEETERCKPQQDDKLKHLIKLLNSKELAKQKVLIFTEFADTARYLYQHLKSAKIDGLAKIDGSTGKERSQFIKRFSPYYNGSSSAEVKDEIRVLISTDVLSEGLNLQDAARLINYDIHWNPVRLMQRIGRVDRRRDPAIEKRIAQAYPNSPNSKSQRKYVLFWNFLPPNELDKLLALYKRVAHKTLLISKTLGIENRKLLRPEDQYDDLRIFSEFDQEYMGEKSHDEEMRLEYQRLVEENPELVQRLPDFPNAIFSGRKAPAKEAHGLFFCYALPALDRTKGEFTLEAGSAKWYFYDLQNSKITEDLPAILPKIRSQPDTPRRCALQNEELIKIKQAVLKHIDKNYLRALQAPQGVKPALKCWMELN